MTLPAFSTAPSVGRVAFDEIRIENTNRCGYRCWCCPRDLHTRAQGIMELSDLGWVLDTVGPFAGRVDLHGFGEPLLDPLIEQRVRMVARRWPQARIRLISTLGVTLPPGCFERLCDAGLAEMEVSCYGHTEESYRLAHGADRFAIVAANLSEACGTAAASGGRMTVSLRERPHHPSVAWKDPDGYESFLETWRIRGVPTRRRQLHNFGARHYNPAGSRLCSVVWGYRRRVLQVTWDLNVIPCCFDFNAEIVLGNLREMTLDDLFHGPAYTRFLAAHMANRLEDYPPCQTCERCDQP